MNSAEWVAQAQAALLEDDPPPAVVFVPAPTWQAAHLPEFRQRWLAVYAAVAGWPPERTAPLHPFREASERAFDLGAEEPWRLALAELEQRAGVTG